MIRVIIWMFILNTFINSNVDASSLRELMNKVPLDIQKNAEKVSWNFERENVKDDYKLSFVELDKNNEEQERKTADCDKYKPISEKFKSTKNCQISYPKHQRSKIIKIIRNGGGIMPSSGVAHNPTDYTKHYLHQHYFAEAGYYHEIKFQVFNAIDNGNSIYNILSFRFHLTCEPSKESEWFKKENIIEIKSGETTIPNDVFTFQRKSDRILYEVKVGNLGRPVILMHYNKGQQCANIPLSLVDEICSYNKDPVILHMIKSPAHLTNMTEATNICMTVESFNYFYKQIGE
ncbi:hypothetical protein SNEBB_000024 [Seison nebaliae]|nr:hypothetical protein SNEBB_000024 [Seison nebaliae]